MMERVSFRWFCNNCNAVGKVGRVYFALRRHHRSLSRHQHSNYRSSVAAAFIAADHSDRNHGLPLAPHLHPSLLQVQRPLPKRNAHRQNPEPQCNGIELPLRFPRVSIPNSASARKKIGQKLRLFRHWRLPIYWKGPKHHCWGYGIKCLPLHRSHPLTTHQISTRIRLSQYKWNQINR